MVAALAVAVVVVVVAAAAVMATLMTTPVAAAGGRPAYNQASFALQLEAFHAKIDKVYVYDSSWLLNTTAVAPPAYYQTMQLLAAIQGIANRDKPRLFLNHTPSDAAWSPFIQDTWFDGIRWEPLDSVDNVIATFMPLLNGSAVYDPKVYSTSLVAASLAGAYDLVPIAFDTTSNPDSWYSKLVTSGKLRAAYNLTGMFTGKVTGSSKCDAYMWAIQELLVSGACNPRVHGYMIDYFWTTVATTGGTGSGNTGSGSWKKGRRDNRDGRAFATNAGRLANTIPNQDYVIARRGFFWDLDVWQDQTPNDDPSQPLGTDYRTLVAILNASNAHMHTQPPASSDDVHDERHSLIHVVGFVPWAFKYVNKKHQGVATEWKMVEVLSSFNAYVDADACCIDSMANAAFFATLPLPSRFVQEPPLSLPALEHKGYVRSGTGKVVPRMYVAFYVGDYDSAAWVYNELKARWDDADRGSVPVGWAVDAELGWRFPPAFLYALNSTTRNDRIISGDSGAGYLNPTQLLAPRKPSGYLSANGTWIAHNTALFRRFDQRFTGFLINGDAGAMTREGEAMYAPFSPLGVVDELNPAQGAPTRLNGNMPVFSQQDLPSDGNASEAAGIIASRFNASNPNPQFFVWRSVLQTPTYYKQIAAALDRVAGDQVAVVDPHVLSALARAQLRGDNSHQVAYEPEEVAPLQPRAGQVVTVTMTVRNDGWTALPANSSMCASIEKAQRRPREQAPTPRARACVELGVSVASGKRATVTTNLHAAERPGPYVLTYQLELADGRGMDHFGNPPVWLPLTVQQ